MPVGALTLAGGESTNDAGELFGLSKAPGDELCCRKPATLLLAVYFASWF